jgi:glycogen debranching enzyme
MQDVEDDVTLVERDWLPVGQEPLPTGKITHLAVLRNDGISSVSLPSGEIDAEPEPSTGVYQRDTRYLSRLSFSFGGVEPVLLDAAQQGQALSAVFTNPAIRAPDGATIAAQTLFVRRRRIVSDRLLDVLTISNYSRSEESFELRVQFAADFRDIFEVRGHQRRSRAPRPSAHVDERTVVFTYDGLDKVQRRSIIRFDPAPGLLTESEASFHLVMAPRQTVMLEVEVCPEGAGPTVPYHVAANAVAQEERAWLERLTHIETDHEALNAAIRRSLLDIRALFSRLDGDRYVAAGVPWFDTLFGRDSLITGIELAPYTCEVLRSSLRLLARYQAKEDDPARDANPGKIPHELRFGELAGAGEVPFGRYYGSVDATPLFIMGAGEYYRWTRDRATIEELWPAIEAAMEWCRRALHVGVEGWLCYQRETAIGLENQGWKDSHDAVCWPDGELVEPPIGLIEVQGYLVSAFQHYAQLARILGRNGVEAAQDAAARLRARIEAEMTAPEVGYCFCIDGRGRPVPTAASNAGHMLWAGAARPDLAEVVARRLMLPDLFSGWGIRTLASTVGRYNPLSYHCGSVWPHENALIYAGMRRYGLDDEASTLGAALIQMALAFPGHRVPELLSGDARELRVVPTPYPVASRPQAWSAASVPYILSNMLGIRPGREGQVVVVRPQLPPDTHRARVRNLRCGGGSIDLAFTRHDGHISVEVENIRGDVEVVLSRNWPEEPGARNEDRGGREP